MMSRKSVRLSISLGVSLVVYCILALSGAGWWALIVWPYGVLAYYDGLTRWQLELQDRIDRLVGMIGKDRIDRVIKQIEERK